MNAGRMDTDARRMETGRRCDGQPKGLDTGPRQCRRAVHRLAWLAVAVLSAGMGCGGGGHGTGPGDGEGTRPPLDLETLGLEFVWIEPGTFLMGSPDTEAGRRAEEGPQHAVTITRGFWMGKHEVTQDQWEQVMGTRPWEGKDYVVAAGRRPAVFVSWVDVDDFVDRLNAAAGATRYLLPTEAEWEYACRAGTQTAWSFGDDPADLAAHGWYAGNAWEAGLQAAQPVGTKLPNPWGLCDCHGNVWEWVYDLYGAYPDSSATDPLGAASGAHHVIRGGSFYYHAADTRSATRYFDHYAHRDSNVGFRLLRVADE